MELTRPGGLFVRTVSHFFRELRSFLLAFVHLGFVDALICGKEQKETAIGSFKLKNERNELPGF